MVNVYNWVKGANWSYIKQQEDSGQYNQALSHALKICEKCRRWKHSLCTGCDLKAKRDELSSQTITPIPVGKPGEELLLW